VRMSRSPENNQRSGAPHPWTFFALVLALATPFWLLSAVTRYLLLPGLPIAALMAICPVAAASILVRKAGGMSSLRAFLLRSLDYRRIKNPVWYVPALLLAPLLNVIAFAVLRIAGEPIPLPHMSPNEIVSLCVMFFVGAAAEELGWSGYATDPLQQRYGAFGCALIVGFVWALFHFVPLVEVGRSFGWIAWWTVGTVALRVLIVWLYDNTDRSVFGATLLHASTNVSWQVFPVHGSYFDPGINGVIFASTALLIVAFGRPFAIARRQGAKVRHPL